MQLCRIQQATHAAGGLLGAFSSGDLDLVRQLKQ